MTHHSKTPVLDAIDEVYNLAYWMTGNEATAGMLVSQTYDALDKNSTLVDLYKSFRNRYLKAFGQTPVMSDEEAAEIADSDVARAVIMLPTDFKMAVLLADVAGLSHHDIAAVLEQPLATVREWLHWGRKLISKELAEQYQN
ncbi:MAG: RNA polymerase subunit sigma-24 [Chloroherpetonaceae bacterium]|nr:RNA polymerase subunit sigma-24 [Chloroherpetonaceae bacterium]MDW8438270.1 sigma factor-like helix-turn-helix DNA-binding protein [Chloroherpetonaceae bacterium]